ncbi:hypothetical protein SAMN05444371_3084 [Epilithonimonas mollis]|uniref:Uncharacterized protein n=1 Tax=Epilithonimonas mollis TaxID=216903 RepID=A0A1M6U2J4_9FLAO|nr:hypothetical protein SAMN05444371_3084 [Epilithonimonas mollis]
MKNQSFTIDESFKVKIITAKDIQSLSEVSLSTAKRIYKSIKETYNIKKVTMYYYIRYYCLD